jgi:hypothetical protein
MFLCLETVAEGWRVAEISGADLTALLRDSCARVQGVVHPFAARGVGKGLATVNREEFLGALSGELSRRAREPAHEFALRISAGKAISGEEDPSKTILVDSEAPNRRDGGAYDQSRPWRGGAAGLQL